MTKHKPGTLEALAEVLAHRVTAVQDNKPRMQVVRPPKRERRIEPRPESTPTWHRQLRITYRMKGLHFRGEFNIPGVAPMSETQLSKLLAALEVARNCEVESIAYEMLKPQPPDMQCAHETRTTLSIPRARRQIESAFSCPT